MALNILVAPLAAEIMQHPPGRLAEGRILTIEAQTPFSFGASQTGPPQIQTRQKALQFWKSDSNCQENEHTERADRHQHSMQTSLAGI